MRKQSKKQNVCKAKVDAEIEFECTMEYDIFSLNAEACGQLCDHLSVFEANPREGSLCTRSRFCTYVSSCYEEVETENFSIAELEA